jgi:hypothetical protein
MRDWLPHASVPRELRSSAFERVPTVDELNHSLMGREFEWGLTNIHLRQVPRQQINTDQEDDDV